MNRLILVYVAIILPMLSMPSLALASACCGSGSSAPGLITADYKYQVQTSLEVSAVVANLVSGEQGIQTYWNPEAWDHPTQTFTLTGAYLLTPLWQIGLGLPIIQSPDTELQIGDITTSFAYEFMPEKEYSNWRPRGLILLTASWPTGPSLYIGERQASQVSGLGTIAPSTGIWLQKIWGFYDLSLVTQIQQPLTILTSTGATQSFRPQFSLHTAAGYSPPWVTDLRIGLRIGQTLQPESTTATGDAIPERRVGDLSLNVTYMFDETTSLGLQYNDQTLFGSARNSELERSLSLVMQKGYF